MHDPTTIEPLSRRSRVSKTSTGSLAVLLLTLPARANDDSKATPTVESKRATEATPAARPRATQAPAREDQDPPIESAQAHYTRGAQAYTERRYAEAIEQFRIADGLAPRSALAFNIARAYEKLDEPARALEHYRDYLRRGADASNREEVLVRVRELEATLAAKGVQQVTVRSIPPGARVSVDGEERGLTPWTAELPLGAHDLHVERRNAAHRMVVTLDGKQTLEVELELSELSHKDVEPAGAHGSLGPRTGVGGASQLSGEQGLEPWPWLALGAGGAALAAAGVFELLRRDAESDARGAIYQPLYHDHRERMQSHQTTARVLLGASAVLVVTGGILTWLDASSHRTEFSPVAVGCDHTACAGTWIGTF